MVKLVPVEILCLTVKKIVLRITEKLSVILVVMKRLLSKIKTNKIETIFFNIENKNNNNDNKKKDNWE